jgi:hypothetical protein
MEEFDMCREEAVKDAIKQFTSQGEYVRGPCLRCMTIHVTVAFGEWRAFECRFLPDDK